MLRNAGKTFIKKLSQDKKCLKIFRESNSLKVLTLVNLDVYCVTTYYFNS